MVLTYNTGNDQRRIACEMLRDFFVNMSGDPERAGKPPFTIEVLDIDWPTYLDYMEERFLTMFIIGWLADFADCDNFARPFMHTYGDFSYYQSYSNPRVDYLIDLAIKTPDGPQRKAMYYELQDIYIDDNPSLPIDQPLGRMWHKRWVKGRYYNAIYPGIYFYHHWKQDTCIADITGLGGATSGIPDGSTNMMDISFICKAYMAYPGHSRWNYRCDIYGDRVINMKDIGTACKHYMHTGPP
jgi:ABC-type transport system substrate-binding protein